MEAVLAGAYWKACKCYYSRRLTSGAASNARRKSKESKELLETFFDSKYSALSSTVTDLHALALLLEFIKLMGSKDRLDHRRIAVKLDGIHLRLGRLAIKVVAKMEQKLQAGLGAILEALERRSLGSVELQRSWWRRWMKFCRGRRYRCIGFIMEFSI